MSFTGQLKVYTGWEWEDGAKDANNLSYVKTFADGVGVNQAEAVFHVDSEELLDSASTTYDLTNLNRQVLGDPDYNITFITIKQVVIVNESTSGELLVGAAASNEWSEPFGDDGDQVSVRPDSPLVLASYRCGWEVDDTTKNLKIQAVGDDVTYSMAIIGTVNSATGECSSSA